MDKNMINLSDFAEMQGVSKRAVQRQWAKHKNDEQIQGHFEIRGNNSVWLDEEAVNYIKTFMNKPNPIVVYDKKTNELLQEIVLLQQALIKSQAENKQLQETVSEQKQLQEVNENLRKKAIATEEENLKLHADLIATVNQNEKLQDENQKLTERAEAAEAEAEALKNRGFLARLFNR